VLSSSPRKISIERSSPGKLRCFPGPFVKKHIVFYVETEEPMIIGRREDRWCLFAFDAVNITGFCEKIKTCL